MRKETLRGKHGISRATSRSPCGHKAAYRVNAVGNVWWWVYGGRYMASKKIKQQNPKAAD